MYILNALNWWTQYFWVNKNICTKKLIAFLKNIKRCTLLWDAFTLQENAVFFYVEKVDITWPCHAHHQVTSRSMIYRDLMSNTHHIIFPIQIKQPLLGLFIKKYKKRSVYHHVHAYLLINKQNIHSECLTDITLLHLKGSAICKHCAVIA